MSHFHMILSMSQAARGLKLAHWLANRLWPRKPAAHGFYEVDDFFQNLYDNRHRPSFIRTLEIDILFRIRERDAQRSEAELAAKYNLDRFLRETA